jgi:outer membrane protein OmpA-like peptidoglycan-associated protein
MNKVTFCILVTTLLINISCGGHKNIKTINNYQVNEVVYFKFDRYAVDNTYQDILNKHIAYLKQNKHAVIILEGHTDQTGTDTYNLDLGDKRARAVQAYLIAAGINPRQIVVVTFGEQLPKDKHKLRLNRRVEFKSVKD